MSSFDPGMTALVVAVLSPLVTIAGLVLTRRSSHEANKIDKFEALTEALERRVTSLEKELETVKKAWADELRVHRVATRHIRELWAWLGGDRSGDPPPVPPALAEEL